MKLSKQTREIINIVIFLLVVGLLLTAFVIYPLNKTAALYERTDGVNASPDTLVINDPAPFIEAGFAIDTFRVESDGLSNLAVIMLADFDFDFKNARGTVFLLPSENSNRDELADLARPLVDTGYIVVAMDLRATGRSSAKYRGEGSLDGRDLNAVIHFLSVRELVTEPIIVAGFHVGGDAGILAARENDMINRVIAYEPYLTTRRMQDKLKEKHGLYWFPFFRSVMWFWYGIRSGYAPPYRDTENLRPVACPTTLVINLAEKTDEVIEKFRELSDSTMLAIVPADTARLQSQILRLVENNSN